VTDLLIVGEGLCGLFAAVLASQHGADTTLVAQGRGGLSLSHGCIDILRDRASATTLRTLPQGHPYKLAGGENLDRALKKFLVITSGGGLAYRGGVEEILRLPTALGGVHATSFAPESLARASLGEIKSFTVGALEGFRDFSAELVRRNLARSGFPVPTVVSLPLLGDVPRRDLYAHDLALRFDDSEWRSELARAWKPRVGGLRLLGVPAVLGLWKHAEVIASLEDKLDLTLFEIPTLPPTLPGLRLERLLRRTALVAGVRLIEGSRALGLVDGRSGGERVAGVVVQAAGGPRTFPSDAVLLATGGTLHGGLIARQNGRILESVFDIPVQHSESRGEWTSERPLGAQPFASYGLRVNSEMRPVSDEGAPYFANLYAAGGIIGGSDRAVEGTRQGIDLLTAFRAVESALGVAL